MKCARFKNTHLKSVSGDVVTAPDGGANEVNTMPMFHFANGPVEIGCTSGQQSEAHE